MNESLTLMSGLDDRNGIYGSKSRSDGSLTVNKMCPEWPESHLRRNCLHTSPEMIIKRL